MPRHSERSMLLRDLEESILIKLFVLAVDGDEEAFDNLEESIPEIAFYPIISQERYLTPRTHVSRDPSRFEWLLNELDNDRFKQELRMRRESFYEILKLIQDNPIFASTPRNPQTDVKIQMMVALEYLGMSGNGDSIGRIARASGVCGGSVLNFTKRFIVAILSLESDVVFWPEEDERREISERIEAETGFPRCVGFVDGSLFPFDCKPHWNGEDFYTKNPNHCISATIVCDDKKLIRYCCTGYTGSSHDARVFANSSLAQNPRSFFSGNEYLLADSAYPATEEIVPAYKKPLDEQLSEEDTRFNSLHTNLHVRVEHCIDILKARFQSLKGIRIRMKDERSIKQVYCWIRCCCVLHNLLLNLGDEFDETYEYEEDRNNRHLCEQVVDNQIESKREAIKSIVLGLQ